MAINARFVSGHGPAKSLGLITLLNAVAAFPAYGAITTTGDISTPGPSTSTLSDNLSIGVNTYGSMSVTDGSDVSSAIGTIAANGGSSGDVDITGAGSTWTNSGELRVGYSGPGTLDIFSGGSVSNTTAFVGRGGTATASLTVDGVGSTWTSSGIVTVGFLGQGTVNVQNGGTATTSGRLDVGGAGGTVDVTGANSQLNSAGLRVGGAAVADLEVTSGGAVVVSGAAELGRSASTTGSLTVNGTGSSLTSTTFTVGAAGVGELDIEAGGVVTNTSNTSIGSGATGSGTATVTGAGSTWNNTTFRVGHAGGGSLSILNGGVVNTISSAEIGRDAGTVGSITVDGAGSKWSVNGSLAYIGHSGQGTLTIQNGGSVTTGVGITLGVNTGSTGTINLSGGVLDMAGKNISVGAGSGTLNFTGGTLKNLATFNRSLVQQGGTLAAGVSDADKTGTTSITGDYTLGASGTLEVEVAGLADFDLYTIGEDAVLAGLLDVSLLGGFAPEEGQFFDVLTADTIDATLLTLAQPSSYSYEIINGAGTQTLRVTVIPEPATFALIAMGVGCIASRRRGGVLAGR